MRGYPWEGCTSLPCGPTVYTTTLPGQGHPGPWHGVYASWPRPEGSTHRRGAQGGLAGHGGGV
eukprot:8916748-Pyramimonas_sp.AAC.1